MPKTINKIHPILSDKMLLFPMLLLCGIGIIMVYSASNAIALTNYGNAFFFLKKQGIFFVLSLGVLFVMASLPYKIYSTVAYIILIMAILLLIAVLIPALNVKAGGANRWLNIGGLTFQPSEFVKLALILFLAYSLSKKQDKIREFFVGFFPHVMVFALLSGLIIFQPDFGTIVILGIITWGMMFVAGVRVFHLLSPLPLLLPILYFMVYKVDYRKERILTFLNPWADPYDSGYQLTHSLKAFGSGGIFGKGIGMGMQKMHYLPEPHTDFIFSIIGEELGLIAVLFIFLLYFFLIYTGIRIAKNAGTPFGAIAAIGITIYLSAQVLINTGVTLGALPTKGLTLPFISYGGTSLIINMAALGILMNIGASKNAKKAA
jgi:cell division protein FtsW